MKEMRKLLLLKIKKLKHNLYCCDYMFSLFFLFAKCLCSYRSTITSKPSSINPLKNSTLWLLKLGNVKQTQNKRLAIFFKHWVLHSQSSQAEALFLAAYTRYAASPTTTAAAPTVQQIKKKRKKFHQIWVCLLVRKFVSKTGRKRTWNRQKRAVD